MKVITEKKGAIWVVTINRPETRNAVDRDTQRLLADTFREFEGDEEAKVAILTGAGGNFSSGADLKAWASGDSLVLSEDGDSPLGPIRLKLSKPVIAAIEGYAVAGGMALACWCDMRVVSEKAIFGMLDRRFGVPIIGAVTTFLPRLIGLSHAMDIILTGRKVDANDAYRMGLANRLSEENKALCDAIELAEMLVSFPWEAVVNDRKALLEGLDLSMDVAQKNEFRLGMATIGSGETLSGATRFASGEGRGGK